MFEIFKLNKKKKELEEQIVQLEKQIENKKDDIECIKLLCSRDIDKGEVPFAISRIVGKLDIVNGEIIFEFFSEKCEICAHILVKIVRNAFPTALALALEEDHSLECHGNEGVDERVVVAALAAVGTVEISKLMAKLCRHKLTKSRAACRHHYKSLRYSDHFGDLARKVPSEGREGARRLFVGAFPRPIGTYNVGVRVCYVRMILLCDALRLIEKAEIIVFAEIKSLCKLNAGSEMKLCV